MLVLRCTVTIFMFRVLGIRSAKILSLFFFFFFSSPLIPIAPPFERTKPFGCPVLSIHLHYSVCFVRFSIIDNPSQFMHSSRRPRGAPITHSQVHGQTPPPPPHSQRVDVHEGLDLQLGGMGSPTHPHGRGHALSMVGGMDIGASADMDGMGGLAMSMPMPMSSAAALGMNLGVVGFVDVGTGASGASGEEEDVGVGMMLGVYHPKHNVRVFFFPLFFSSIFVHHMYDLLDGKTILGVDDGFVQVVAFVAS